MVLTETESKVLHYLRYPIVRMREKHSPVEDLSDEEVASLYNKMDDIIKDEGDTRRSFGDFDEMYVIELSCVKDSLLKEVNNRGLNRAVN